MSTGKSRSRHGRCLSAAVTSAVVRAEGWYEGAGSAAPRGGSARPPAAGLEAGPTPVLKRKEDEHEREDPSREGMGRRCQTRCWRSGRSGPVTDM